LTTLLEAAILEKVEQVAGVLAGGREVIDAKQAADFLPAMTTPSSEMDRSKNLRLRSSSPNAHSCSL
jgi:hypothetical protein